jgi:hypothetical protein
VVQHRFQSSYKASKEVLDYLQSKGLIDQKAVIWWQKGFEGRRVFGEEEFSQGLIKIEFETFLDSKLNVTGQKKYNVWYKNDVPIVLRDYNFEGISVKTLISVKPMSHHHNEGWRELSMRQSNQPSLPLSVYYSPHIRGVVVEDTSDFVFWLPFGIERKMNSYLTVGHNNLFNNQDMFIIFMPIHPSRFCENLMKSLKGGRLAQRKNERWNFTKDNFEAVPYYDFYQEKSQLTIFPASVLEQSLDVPLIIKGNPLEILGSGFIEDNLDYMQAVFLKLDQKKFDKAKKSLTERLDLKF